MSARPNDWHARDARAPDVLRVRVAQNTAYATREGRRPIMRYRSMAWDAAEPRIALAGYCLAGMLNTALGS